ncbi:MAG: glycosyltransferase [Planctomycetota bacterium]|nr:glycosyltransferase [Planctomycetota bacterium]
MHTFLPLLAIAWFLWLCLAWGSVWKVRKFRGLYTRPRRGGFDNYRPRATVVVPFKGVDTDLVSGVRSLCTQDYPDYRLLLVVDSGEDPAYPVLARELERYPGRGEILVAGPAGPREGQKIHNQLAALERMERESGDEEAWVFADSDAVPGPAWLGALVGPLCNVNTTAVTTGYRWLIPVDGAPGWTRLASVMNSSVACQLGKDRLNHAWGGSMAVLAATARRGGLRERLVGALCDDYQFTHMARDMGLRVYYVARCLVATPAKMTWPGLMNFAHRQYLLTRVYVPGLFMAGLGLTSIYVVGFFSAVASLAATLAMNCGSHAWAWPTGVLALAFLADQVRATQRAQVVRLALGEQAFERLRPTLRLDRWATPVWMTLHWLIIVRSAFGRVMNWRGIRYRLDGPQSVERLD